MTIFPGQDIVFRRIGNFNKRHNIDMGVVAIIILGLTFASALIYFSDRSEYRNRKIDYLVTIDSVEYRLHKNGCKVKEMKMVYCTDQDGNQYSFPDMIPTVMAIEFEQGKRYIIKTEFYNPRRITSAETVTADKWLETDQQKE